MKILVENIEKKTQLVRDTTSSEQMSATVMTPSQGGSLDNQPLSVLLLARKTQVPSMS